MRILSLMLLLITAITASAKPMVLYQKPSKQPGNKQKTTSAVLGIFHDPKHPDWIEVSDKQTDEAGWVLASNLVGKTILGSDNAEYTITEKHKSSKKHEHFLDTMQNIQAKAKGTLKGLGDELKDHVTPSKASPAQIEATDAKPIS